MNKHTPTFNAWQNLENAIRSANIASFDIQTAEKLFNYPKRNRNKMSMAEFTQIFGILQKKNIPKLKPVLLEFRQLFANNCVGTGEIDPERFDPKIVYGD